MKKILLTLSMSLLTITMSCNSVKNEKPKTDIQISNLKTLTVTAIENSEGYYTASLKDGEGGLYVCTVSHSDLGDNYIRIKAGDKVKIAGDYAESHPVQIFAKRIIIVQ